MENKKYVTTAIELSVHKKGENPYYGDSAVVVRIKDDGDSPYLVITSIKEEDLAFAGQVTLDIDQLNEILENANVAYNMFVEAAEGVKE